MSSVPLRPGHRPPPVYALGQLTIRDRARYLRYVRRFQEVLALFGGRLLAADESPQVVEGAWERDKVILLAFENADAFWAFARSDAYQEIARDRLASTEGSVLLVHGIG